MFRMKRDNLRKKTRRHREGYMKFPERPVFILFADFHGITPNRVILSICHMAEQVLLVIGG